MEMVQSLYIPSIYFQIRIIFFQSFQILFYLQYHISNFEFFKYFTSNKMIWPFSISLFEVTCFEGILVIFKIKISLLSYRRIHIVYIIMLYLGCVIKKYILLSKSCLIFEFIALVKGSRNHWSSYWQIESHILYFYILIYTMP